MKRASILDRSMPGLALSREFAKASFCRTNSVLAAIPDYTGMI